MFSLHQNSNYQITEEFSKDMELLQYDILCGKRYTYQGEDLYPASQLQMGVQDITAERLEEQEDGLHIYGTNFTPWSKVFINDAKVSTSFVSDTELIVSMGNFKEGANSLVVNQMGSSDTIFRSSNVLSYFKTSTESEDGTEEQAPPVEDTIENTPSSIDKEVNGNHSEVPQEEMPEKETPQEEVPVNETPTQTDGGVSIL